MLKQKNKSHAVPYVAIHDGQVDIPFDKYLDILDAACIWTKLVVLDIQDFIRETEAMLDAA